MVFYLVSIDVVLGYLCDFRKKDVVELVLSKFVACVCIIEDFSSTSDLLRSEVVYTQLESCPSNCCISGTSKVVS